MVAADAGGLAPDTGWAQHQVDQGVGAVGVHVALIPGAPGVAGVFIEYGVDADGISGGQIGTHGGHPVGFGPHPPPPLTPNPLGPSLGSSGVSGHHRAPRRGPQLPGVC